MLREIRTNRQNPGEPPRRWFQSEDMDLFVWAAPGARPVRVELSYDKTADECALSWSEEDGYAHHRVVNSDGAGGHPASSLLVSEPDADLERITTMFVAQAVEIDPAVRDFVLARLGAWSDSVHDDRRPEQRAGNGRRANAAAAVTIIGAFILLMLVVAGLSHVSH